MADSFLLTDEEVCDITGYQKPARQMDALGRFGITAHLNARNKVVVSRRHAEDVLAGKTSQNAVLGPNLDWMES
ncbi:DUF4224 domain-containing protein [Parendozoicomonas haliclonae]|uniref:DUF4224 domain-containing protein n=1 Tax=Parendozoicomonas haliclonae TaxID=1960125 RepID=A0A1X7AFW1_9GAMM|nr:DUF4224 domain-containing protein [Parendozoicomonas haliclonae]SMA36380.1 hypothetical protein EHSB41UT_00634 [Parendozoicomonas haliclonae]